MRQTTSEIVTEICMSRDGLPWLIVEGESDERLFRNRPMLGSVKIVLGYGWEGVRDVLIESEQEKCTCLVCGVIDRDYREHLGINFSLCNLVLTDYLDIENMLFSSDALVRVLTEYGSQSKLPKTNDTPPQMDICSIRSKIYDVCDKLGKLRVYCQMVSHNISFQGIEHKKFLCDRTLQLDLDNLLLHINGKNAGFTNISKEYWDAAQRLTWDQVHLNSSCFLSNGHDLMAALHVALRRLWGTGVHHQPETIEKFFRMAYRDDELSNTQMMRSILKIFSARRNTRTH